MYCLIKTRQVCKSSMPSPNFTLINRSLWKPSFKTSCFKIISEQVALMPASVGAVLKTGSAEVSPATSQRKSQATARPATAAVARTPETRTWEECSGTKCGRENLHKPCSAPRARCHRVSDLNGRLPPRTPAVPLLLGSREPRPAKVPASRQAMAPPPRRPRPRPAGWGRGEEQRKRRDMRPGCCFGNLLVVSARPGFPHVVQLVG